MTLDEWAAEIYAAFPKKVDRARALVAIKRCLTRRRVTARQLLQYTEAYANHVRPLRDTDGWGVVLQPATYYNGERWNDRVGDRATDRALKELLAERKKRELAERQTMQPGQPSRAQRRAAAKAEEAHRRLLAEDARQRAAVDELYKRLASDMEEQVQSARKKVFAARPHWTRRGLDQVVEPLVRRALVIELLPQEAAQAGIEPEIGSET